MLWMVIYRKQKKKIDKFLALKVVVVAKDI